MKTFTDGHANQSEEHNETIQAGPSAASTQQPALLVVPTHETSLNPNAVQFFIQKQTAPEQKLTKKCPVQSGGAPSAD